MSRRALICGISGQDGAYLAQLLLRKGYEVWGSSRDAEMNSFRNLHTLNIFKDVRLVSLNTSDLGSTLGLLRQCQPDEVFSLAGQSSVGLSYEQPIETMQSIAQGTLNFLEAIRLSAREIRFYNAGSTECFGDTGDYVADEESPLRPRSPYAVAKASAFWTVRAYREAYGMHACTGILSNHESPLRPRRFVTRKIIHAVASLALGGNERLSLGNLNIERDWGWAPDYVDAIARMLAQDAPADYLIATGRSHTLTEFVATAYRLIDRDWQEFVTLDPELIRPTDIAHNKVNVSKAAVGLGWRPKYYMQDVIAAMLDAELGLLREERNS
ncbi:GDP-mannose 4,6-dehydratase [Terriglobus roseus]|uniref:GDP-mannose 4,6-dehydratase n=1 Tax=Terriglobus roseus TaxID=392734 RepID=A0A1G7NCT6_9BACT|nr:GDP-mannose 4,6-dehydratase [Terriglobus roseus]SDF71751.1 GDPmannose 4,6-dehydratase [Terriglobus roseus]